MEWKDVLKRPDIVGGECETQEGGFVYRGPILSIGIDGDTVVITSPWVAKLEPGAGWVVYDNHPLFFSARESRPQDIGEGRIHFSIPHIGVATIFPKGGSQLDVTKVRGLAISHS